MSIVSHLCTQIKAPDVGLEFLIEDPPTAVLPDAANLILVINCRQPTTSASSKVTCGQSGRRGEESCFRLELARLLGNFDPGTYCII
jgi:hypothetical protein